MKSVFDLAFGVMNTSVSLEGFTFTIWQFFIFCAILFLVSRLVFRIFD